MKRIITAILTLMSLWVAAQDTVTVYYNDRWEEIKEASSAAFYRKAYKGSDGFWIANDYFKNGQLQMSGTYKSLKSEVKHGWFNYFFENGVKQSEVLFLNDVFEGESKNWNKNGKLVSIINYSNGDVIKEQAYYANGQLKYQGSFRFNKPHGLWQYWDHNGRLTLEGNFKNGEHSGNWTRYLPDSTVTYTYSNGVLNEDVGILIRGRDL